MYCQKAHAWLHCTVRNIADLALACEKEKLSFLGSIESFLVFQIKNTWLIWLSHLFFYDSASMLYAVAKWKVEEKIVG